MECIHCATIGVAVASSGDGAVRGRTTSGRDGAAPGANCQ